MSILPAFRARYSPSLKPPSDRRKKVRPDASSSTRIPKSEKSRSPVEMSFAGSRTRWIKSNQYVSGIARLIPHAHGGRAGEGARDPQKTQKKPGSPLGGA